jgi:hypothetical protein
MSVNQPIVATRTSFPEKKNKEKLSIPEKKTERCYTYPCRS